MGYEVRDPNPDELLPDAREDVYTWYTMDELHNARWIPSPVMDEDPNEWFVLTDGRTVCLYSIDLDYPEDGDLLVTTLPQPATDDQVR